MTQKEAVALLNTLVAGRTVARIEHPVDIGEGTRIVCTDGTSVDFNLEARRVEVTE